ncbi:hypothetical protein P7K49_023707 [Saguinus oedipus]|uniref:Uncharacterized protein n=1 Tax=Saguinus oedipus TaxID=9490 RepID=A0ABQ9UN20_SAGOE|nr:hypothetical protein P7K49_023707 [Saguinus oedipus]
MASGGQSHPPSSGAPCAVLNAIQQEVFAEASRDNGRNVFSNDITMKSTICVNTRVGMPPTWAVQSPSTGRRYTLGERKGHTVPRKS